MPAVCAVSAADAESLRLIARRTWRFFETFVTAEDNMLPPDNFQEDPKPVVAQRTSPTNLGLLLLSTVAARDFGWIGTLETVERLEATLGDDGAPEALSRPFLQLVRHGRSSPARAALHLVGRQRQSRRPPDRARQRLRGVARHASPTQPASPPARATAWRSPARRCSALPDDRRTQLVSPRELDGALDDLAAPCCGFRIDWTSSRGTPQRPPTWPAR